MPYPDPNMHHMQHSPFCNMSLMGWNNGVCCLIGLPCACASSAINVRVPTMSFARMQAMHHTAHTGMRLCKGAAQQSRKLRTYQPTVQ